MSNVPENLRYTESHEWVDPADVPYLERGLVRSPEGDWITAEELEKLSKEARASLDSGRTHAQSMANLKRVERIVRDATDSRGGRADVHDQLGRYRFQIEQFEQAIEHWGHALEIDPEFPEARRHVGHALLSLGRPEEGRAELRRKPAETLCAGNPLRR